VEGTCLCLSFDGENCTYEGQTEFAAGPVTFLFFNESEGDAGAALLRHHGDKTIQDMLDTFVDGYSEVLRPAWVSLVDPTLRYVPPGESYTWEGVLDPGIHTALCAPAGHVGVWFGAGLTVED
jgi:hypothetical protein